MKQVSKIAAVLAVTLTVVGCSCHRPVAYTETAPVQDNSAYQSDAGSKFGGKLGHVHHHHHHHHHCTSHSCATHTQ